MQGRRQLTWLLLPSSSPTDVMTVSEKTICPVRLFVIYKRTGTLSVKQQGFWTNPTSCWFFAAFYFRKQQHLSKETECPLLPMFLNSTSSIRTVIKRQSRVYSTGLPRGGLRTSVQSTQTFNTSYFYHSWGLFKLQVNFLFNNYRPG